MGLVVSIILKWSPAKESWGGGEEELRRLRWSSSPRKQLYINRKVNFKIFAIP